MEGIIYLLGKKVYQEKEWQVVQKCRIGNKLNIEDMNQMLKIYLLWFNFAKKLFYFVRKKNNKKIHFFFSKNKN